MRAIGLTRVSTSEQALSGLGLEAQREAIRECAERLGAELVEVFEDAGVSGSAPLEERTGLLQAINALGADTVLIVARRDRLGRDVVLNALVQKLVTSKGAKIVSASGEGSELDGPTGDLVRTILDAISQYEKALIGLRTKAALRAKLARGERVGRAPFGLRWDAGKLVAASDEQNVIALVRLLRDEGRTLREVVLVLHDRGVRGRTGRPLGISQVHALLADSDRKRATSGKDAA